MLPLFFQTESTKSTKVATASVHLIFNGRLCCGQEGGELLQIHKEWQRRGRKKGATRLIMSVLPYPPNINCYRLGKKEHGSEDNELNKKHGEASPCFSCPTARWSTQDYGLHCTACSSQRVAWATLFSKSAWNKPVHIFAAREQSISSYVKRADRKLWGDTYYKINQQSYAHHSFQLWQVTPPARIKEYIYNSIA